MLTLAYTQNFRPVEGVKLIPAVLSPVDCLALSSSLLFSMNYAKSFKNRLFTIRYAVPAMMQPVTWTVLKWCAWTTSTC
ncbi:MAG: hypothetical protein LBV26_01895 [Bacteroidales bacterium]|nr:hypothetical protein [Bacteroidales bacterium]